MKQMVFKSRGEFRDWLTANALSNEGVWLVFSKQKPGGALKAGEALEEALCFGWIDGQVQSIDETTYLKYFKQRGVSSNWSEKNKKLAGALEEKGLMTGYGRAKIDLAKQNGHWEQAETVALSEEQIQAFELMLEPFALARENFGNMPVSARKAYMRSYFFGAKTDEGKQKRLATIVERLNLNLNPMESMKKKLESTNGV